MKKILIPISTLFVAGISHAQTSNLSTDQNYVYTKTYIHHPAPADADQTIKSSETVQYLDGLGRPKQVINIKASPLGRDVVSHFVYDQYGRQAQDFLPVPQGGTANGAIVTDPTANAVNTPLGNEIIFSKKEFEASPLDRVLEQKQVGTAWSSKPVKFEYDANADGEVKKYTATFNYSNFTSEIVLSSAGYGANQLYKNTVIDEDGNKTIEFKNGQGQTILVRKMLDGTNSADTYYVYNDYNQLAYVIPPLAVTANAVDQTTLNNLCYQYKYDARNRLVEKKLPGKGWEFMLYDKQDRLVATRDANLEEKGQWLYTKYDEFGRVVLTGLSTGGSRISEQANVETFNSNNTVRLFSSTVYNEASTVDYRPFLTYPDNTKNIQLLSVNYYDVYPSYVFNPAFPSSIHNVSVITDNSTGNNISTKSLPVMSFVKNIEDDNWTKSYTWYDAKGRSIAGHSINHLGGYTKTESKLDFSGTPLQVVTKHKRLDSDTERVITENFTYDHQNRLKTHTHQIDNNSLEYLAQNDYNELSQLKTKKVGGSVSGNGLQTVDYAYNIRGWMTHINDPVNLGNDLFGYKIKYTSPEYTAAVSGRYNGNIAEIDWNMSTVNSRKRYTYAYDGLNRLLDAVYTEPDQTDPNTFYYNENLTYDRNGNIKTLKRFAYPDVGNTIALKVDDLDYQYEGNRLTQIVEMSLNIGYEGGNGIIGYDNNGNMTSMPDKGIFGITYNYLNLPSKMSIWQPYNPALGSYNLDYLYRADGVKLRKKFTSVPERSGDVTTKITDYLDGFHYNQTQVTTPCVWCPIEFAYEERAYRNVDPIPIGLEPAFVLDFVPTSEGFYSFTENRYIYQYRDHLGNARVSYAKKTDGTVEITDTNDYYAFGLNHIGGVDKGYLGSYYNYKYNGKELQETGMYDYGARFYMPDIGRWGAVDPLAEKYINWSPYNYSINNPIRWIDPDGRGVTDVVLRGDQAKEAFEQLKNASSNLNLKMDSNGKVTGTLKKGAAATKAESTLLSAMSNKNVVVDVLAQSSNVIESDNTVIFGGAFRGSTTNSSIDASLEGSPNTITHANQIINPTDLGTMDTYYSAVKGVGVMHEILEAYDGAINSPGAVNTIGSKNREVSWDSYLSAHNNASALDPRINYNLQSDNKVLPRATGGNIRIERTLYRQVNGIRESKSLGTVEIKPKTK